MQKQKRFTFQDYPWRPVERLPPGAELTRGVGGRHFAITGPGPCVAYFIFDENNSVPYKILPKFDTYLEAQLFCLFYIEREHRLDMEEKYALGDDEE